MKYEIGQKVRVKGLSKTGEIRGYKVEGFLAKGGIKEVIQYQINFGSYFNDWYEERALEPFESYEFDDKFEQGLKEFLIDTYLLYKKLDVVKLLINSNKA